MHFGFHSAENYLPFRRRGLSYHVRLTPDNGFHLKKWQKKRHGTKSDNKVIAAENLVLRPAKYRACTYEQRDRDDKVSDENIHQCQVECARRSILARR